MPIDMRELGVVKIASPCRADWASMEGDEQVRHCGQCRKNVYNLSSMTADDARALLLEKEGKLCVRFYQRKDGTMLTSDCPKGVQRKRVRLVAVVASGVSLVLAGTAFVLDSGGFGAAASRIRALVTGKSCPANEAELGNGDVMMGEPVMPPPSKHQKRAYEPSPIPD